MSYDQILEERINRKWLEEFPTIHPYIEAKKMFGGLSYLFRGKMTVGIVGDSLAVRVPASQMEAVLEEDSVRPMDFTGRPLKEFIFVGPEGYRESGALSRWLTLGLKHAEIQLAAKDRKAKK